MDPSVPTAGPGEPPRRRRPDWTQTFLRVYRDSANTRLSAEAAGVSRSTVYRRAERDPRFAAAWQDAEEDAADELEAIARDRAMRSSDGLLKWLLSAARPQKYRAGYDVRAELRAEIARLAAELGLPEAEVRAAAERTARELGR